MQKNKCT